MDARHSTSYNNDKKHESHTTQQFLVQPHARRILHPISTQISTGDAAPLVQYTCFAKRIMLAPTSNTTKDVRQERTPQNRSRVRAGVLEREEASHGHRRGAYRELHDDVGNRAVVAVASFSCHRVPEYITPDER